MKITKKLADMSTLGDAAYWIGDACQLEFGKTRENLDIYHALEYLSEKVDLLYGKETPESKVWFETMKWDLLNIGSDCSKVGRLVQAKWKVRAKI